MKRGFTGISIVILVLTVGCPYETPPFDNPIDPRNVTLPPLGFPGSMYFPSDGSMLSVFNSSPLDVNGSEITMEAWLYLDSSIVSENNYWVLSKQQIDGVRSWGFFVGTDYRVHPSIATTLDGHLEIGVGLPIATNTWVHVAVVYNGSDIRVYHDGDLAGSVSKSGEIATNPRELTIGGTYWLPSDSFAGYITEVRVWNVARTAAQIREGIAADVVGSSGIVALYRMHPPEDHGIGAPGENDITDSGPHGLHADIEGGAEWSSFTPTSS